MSELGNIYTGRTISGDAFATLQERFGFYLTLNVTESNVYTSNFSESPAHLTAEAVHLCCQNMNNLQLNITPSRLLILKHSVGVQPET